MLAEVSENLGEPMTGINCDDLKSKWAARESGNLSAAPKGMPGSDLHKIH